MSTGIDPLSLLQALVGSEQSINRNTGNNTTSSGSQNSNVTGSQTSNSTGSQTSQQDQSRTGTTNTSGTSSSTQSGSSSGTNSTTTQGTQSGSNTSITGTQSGVTGNTTQQQTGTITNFADVSALQDILRRQQAGPSAEALQALFRVGSAGAPQLMSMYANAAGARTSNNAPAAVALQGMMQKIMDQAALMQKDSLTDAAGTAARIAQLTSGQTTSGTTQGTSNQASTQTSSQSGSQSSTSTQNQVGTQTQAGSQVTNTATTQQQQMMEQLRNLLSGQNTQNTQQTNSQNTQQTNNNTQQVTGNEDTSNRTSIDDGRAMKLLGLILGGSALNNGLTQAGLGGLSGALGSATQAVGGGIASLLRGLGIGGTGGQSLDEMFGQSSPAVTGGTDLSDMDALLASILQSQGAGGMPFDLTQIFQPDMVDEQEGINPFDLFPADFWGDPTP